MMSTFVSVVIPVFNDCERLSGCLAALQDQSYPKDRYEVIVVDNGNNEGIEGIVELFSQVKLVCEAKPGSYAARNKGVALARGEVIAFTDADCVPSHDWIEKGGERLAHTSHCGLVGGKVERFFKIPGCPNPVEYYDSITYLNQERAMREYHGVLTANAFTFKKVFERVGLFDERSYSGEDYSWAKRVFLSGFAQIYAPDVIVKHPARHSFRALYARIARQEGSVHMLSSARGEPLRLYLRPDLFMKNLLGQSCNNARSSKRIMHKLSFVMVTLFASLCRVIEFVRFIFRGKPKR